MLIIVDKKKSFGSLMLLSGRCRKLHSPTETKNLLQKNTVSVDQTRWKYQEYGVRDVQMTTEVFLEWTR